MSINNGMSRVNGILMPAKIRAILIRSSIVGVSFGVALILSELILRTVIHPADYLGVEMVYDSVLGAVPAAHTKAGGFDAWGFRNKEVPDRVDILAIGDSHTYGNTARMTKSWPYVLGSLTGLQVYNMGLGGYGPNQYFHLLSKGLTLNPRIVICGLYMGDDFENAFLITYGLEHWAYLRELPDRNVDPDIWPQTRSVSWHKKSRVWLSRHSVAYQLLFHGPLMGLIHGEYQIEHASDLYPGSATMVWLPAENVKEAFLPVGILRRLNQDSPAVREGMRISFQLLQGMQQMSHDQGAEFICVVIPTKESVFAEYIENKRHLPLSLVLDEVIANERLARRRVFQFLDRAAIPYIDTLPALRGAAGEKIYAKTAADIHPNQDGYEVIAKRVSEYLEYRSE